jgi:glycosyltransferase involved in cell wall biosynthesis
MKILIVHEVNYLRKIIYEFQILPEILSTLGHDVTIIDYDDTWKTAPPGEASGLKTRVHRGVHRAYSDASVTVRRPGMIRMPIVARVSAALTTGFDLYGFLRDYSPDAVLLYGLPTVGLQSLLAARHFNVPVVFRSIDILNQLVPSKVLVPVTRMMEHYVYNRVDAVLTVTMHLRNHILSYGVPESRVSVLPSGVDTQMFSPGPRKPDLLRNWGIGPEDEVILFMGTVYKFSGLDRVIRDFPRLLSRRPRAKLLVVGCGEGESALKVLAVEAGVKDSIVFAGLHPYSALPDIIRSSDVCINPFELNSITRDILPTKLFQYLACAKPVVATRLPGTIPFLAGEEHGMVYCALEDFVDCIADLLDAPARCQDLGHKGGQVTRANYEWTRIAEKTVQVLNAHDHSAKHYQRVL